MKSQDVPVLAHLEGALGVVETEDPRRTLGDQPGESREGLAPAEQAAGPFPKAAGAAPLKALNHPAHVPVHHGARFAVADTGNGRRRVSANAG